MSDSIDIERIRELIDASRGTMHRSLGVPSPLFDSGAHLHLEPIEISGLDRAEPVFHFTPIESDSDSLAAQLDEKFYAANRRVRAEIERKLTERLRQALEPEHHEELVAIEAEQPEREECRTCWGAGVADDEERNRKLTPHGIRSGMTLRVHERRAYCADCGGTGYETTALQRGLELHDRLTKLTDKVLDLTDFKVTHRLGIGVGHRYGKTDALRRGQDGTDSP